MRRALCIQARHFLVAVVLACSACGKQTVEPEVAEENLQQFELVEIGGLYDVHLKEKQRPPTSLNDFKPYDVGFPSGFLALQEGRCIAVWGLNPANISDRTHTVVAYQKETPAHGGYVLLADLSVKKVSADDFKSLAKPAQ
jgi:hypothetical protein